MLGFLREMREPAQKWTLRSNRRETDLYMEYTVGTP